MIAKMIRGAAIGAAMSVGPARWRVVRLALATIGYAAFAGLAAAVVYTMGWL